MRAMNLAEAFSMPILVDWRARENDLSLCGRPLKQKEAKMSPNRPRGLKLPKCASCIRKTKAGARKKRRSSNLTNSGPASGMRQNEAEQAKSTRSAKTSFQHSESKGRKGRKLRGLQLRRFSPKIGEKRVLPKTCHSPAKKALFGPAPLK
jgi:hypothetical protein